MQSNEKEIQVRSHWYYIFRSPAKIYALVLESATDFFPLAQAREQAIKKYGEHGWITFFEQINEKAFIIFQYKIIHM